MNQVVLTEAEKVEMWRTHIATECGCDPEDARRFAVSEGDLHQLVQMIESGCDPALAVSILV